MTTNTRRTLGTLAIAAAIAPLAVHAQLGNSPLEQTLERVKGLLNFFLGAAIPIATAVFFWGVIKYLTKADDEKARAQGKTLMINGGIGLFMMVGIWSIIAYATSSIGGLNSGDTNYTPPPTVNIPQVH